MPNDDCNRRYIKTDEDIIADAKCCSTLKEFRERFPSSELLSRRRGLQSLMPWLQRKKLPDRYWTYERCLEESRKYIGQGRFAFQKGSAKAYKAAYANGWLDDMTWLGFASDPMKDGMYFVYAYKFEATRVVYVGLTMDKTRRDRDHRSGERFSAVYRYSQESGVEIPFMTILESGLLASQAQHLEGVWVDKFKEAGWTLLNKGKVGDVVSSLGSLVRKWTTKLAVEESRKYKTRSEFATLCPKGFRYISSRNLWSLVPWLPSKGNVTAFKKGQEYSFHRVDESEFLRVFRESNPSFETIQIVGDYRSANQKIHVRCLACGHEWDARPRLLMKGFGCRICGYKKSSKTKKESDYKMMSKSGLSFADVFPQLIPQWNTVKNGNLTPYNVSPYSNRTVWWVCACGHEWEAKVYEQSRVSKGCPYCANRKVLPGFNDLAHKFPSLMLEWDERRNDFNPSEVLPTSSSVAWWICPHGHKYHMSIERRVKGIGCPQCRRLQK